MLYLIHLEFWDEESEYIILRLDKPCGNMPVYLREARERHRTAAPGVCLDDTILSVLKEHGVHASLETFEADYIDMTR